MKLAPDVIFYSNMIITATENASNKREMRSAVNKELAKWNIPVSKALECIDQYAEYLDKIIKEHETLVRGKPSGAIYERYKIERSILTKVRTLLETK